MQNEGSWGSAGTSVSYQPPVVHALFPPGGAVGSTLSIQGEHLGSAESAASGETQVERSPAPIGYIYIPSAADLFDSQFA